MEIWVRNYITNSNNDWLPMYFAIINGKEMIIKQNSDFWKNSEDCEVSQKNTNSGTTQDRKLKTHEIIALKMLGIIEL